MNDPINIVMWLKFICIEPDHVWDMLKILIYFKSSNLEELSSLSALRKAFEMDRNGIQVDCKTGPKHSVKFQMSFP